MDVKLYRRRIRHTLTAPFIYSVFIAIIVLDIFVELYHRIGFRLCKLELVKRSDYIKIDRHKLKYLNWFDKINCAYCDYSNGVLRYACEIAARTEKYWCGIKHKQYKGFKEPKHHKNFLKYGDKKAFNKKFKNKKSSSSQVIG